MKTHTILWLFGSSAFVGHCLFSLAVCLIHQRNIIRRLHNTPNSSVNIYVCELFFVQCSTWNYETAPCHCCNQSCCVDITSAGITLYLLFCFVFLISSFSLLWDPKAFTWQSIKCGWHWKNRCAARSNKMDYKIACASIVSLSLDSNS